MNFLDKLTRDERELLASLPYRVGCWVSQSDDSGGAESDEQEKRVLNSIVEGFAVEVFGAEMVQYIMMETVSRKDKWEEWSKMDPATIPTDCKRAVGILLNYGDEKSITAFSHHLMEIAEAVAMSFSEYQFTSIIGKIRMYYLYYRESIKASLRKERYKSLHEFLSISAGERAVLQQLAEALGMKYV